MDYSLKQKIEKYFSKSASEEEIKEVQAWLASKPNQTEVEGLMQKDWESITHTVSSPREEQVLDNILLKIDLIEELRSEQQTSRRSRRTLSILLKIAATVLLPLSVILWYYHYDKPSDHNHIASYQTRSDERKMIDLPDGSAIHLNKGSEMTYEVDSRTGERKVSLKGEAYFKVAKSNRAFIVASRGLIVKVLGTSFNVNAYPSDSTVLVALEEGKVSLSKASDTSSVIFLMPDNVAKFSIKNQSLAIQEGDVELFSLWKEHKLIFKNEPFDQMVKKLERWYGVAFEIKAKDINHCRFDMVIEKESLKQVLELINLASPMDYIIQEKVVTIKRMACKK